MSKLPEFALYGDGDSTVENKLQPALALRKWSDLFDHEKRTAFRELENNGWLDDYSREILATVSYLNHTFLRQCPGKNLHSIKPEAADSYRGFDNSSERMKAALADFEHIFMQEKSDAMVFRMFSKFASCYIDGFHYGLAEREKDDVKREENINDAFEKFDRLANCLNHIFEQFAVNQLVTRNGFVPRQDEKISSEVYEPTLKVLADPKWQSVNDDLARMFEDYRSENYAEVITKAHGAVQRFLQILVGEEGKNAKGEVGKLFQKAKDDGKIPVNRFTEPIINTIQGFIVSERATNSTAKPTLKDATASDALLVMNVVMVLLQHCLQNPA